MGPIYNNMIHIQGFPLLEENQYSDFVIGHVTMMLEPNSLGSPVPAEKVYYKKFTGSWPEVVSEIQKIVPVEHGPDIAGKKHRVDLAGTLNSILDAKFGTNDVEKIDRMIKAQSKVEFGNPDEMWQEVMNEFRDTVGESVQDRLDWYKKEIEKWIMPGSLDQYFFAGRED